MNKPVRGFALARASIMAIYQAAAPIFPSPLRILDLIRNLMTEVVFMAWHTRHGLIRFMCMIFFVGFIEAQELDPSLNHLEKDRIETLQGELKKVSLADGISAAEAGILTRVYSELYIGCGHLDGVTDAGDHWLVSGTVGRGAHKVQGYKIMKDTGKIISTVGPSFGTYLNMFE